MLIHLIRQSISEVRAPWIVLFWFEDEGDLPPELQAAPVCNLILRLSEQRELSGSLGELTALHGVGGLSDGSVLVAGLGRREKFDAGATFSASLAAAKRLAGKPREHVAFVLPGEPASSPAGWISALVEGLVVGTQGPGLHKSEPTRHAFGAVDLIVAPERTEADWAVIERQVRRGEMVGQAVNLARHLVNTPPAEKCPTRLAEQVRISATDAGMSVQVWDETRIRQERFGGLIGVAAGSENPPAFVILDYRRAGDSPPVALVGKGVTFDSGGLSLKPSASMEDMKSDMTGAAVVAATMQAIARLNLPLNVTGYLALTENMTGGRAMKLGDVLTMRNGKTVEVLNTDAEGRLILADALSFAAEQPHSHLVDIATLTGACMVALGSKVAGIFSNDEMFSQSLLAACRRTGERAWALPLDEDFKEQLKSNVADLKNVGGKWGGAITAAKFLEQFIGEKPWIHLDIAGPSWSESDSAVRDSGGTGCFVRTLVSLLETLPS
jgi:leucyl aminopeptidase